jgi:hypothetical protein
MQFDFCVSPSTRLRQARLNGEIENRLTSRDDLFTVELWKGRPGLY